MLASCNLTFMSVGLMKLDTESLTWPSSRDEFSTTKSCFPTRRMGSLVNERIVRGVIKMESDAMPIYADHITGLWQFESEVLNIRTNLGFLNRNRTLHPNYYLCFFCLTSLVFQNCFWLGWINILELWISLLRTDAFTVVMHPTALWH